jgi:hypothetical protein
VDSLAIGNGSTLVAGSSPALSSVAKLFASNLPASAIFEFHFFLDL